MSRFDYFLINFRTKWNSSVFPKAGRGNIQWNCGWYSHCCHFNNYCYCFRNRLLFLVV